MDEASGRWQNGPPVETELSDRKGVKLLSCPSEFWGRGHTCSSGVGLQAASPRGHGPPLCQFPRCRTQCLEGESSVGVSDGKRRWPGDGARSTCSPTGSVSQAGKQVGAHVTRWVFHRDPGGTRSQIYWLQTCALPRARLVEARREPGVCGDPRSDRRVCPQTRRCAPRLLLAGRVLPRLEAGQWGLR